MNDCLETPRLILRKFNYNDASDVYKNWGTDSKCNKYLPWELHKNIEETKEIIKKWIEEYDKGKFNWAIILKETNEVIGAINLVNISKNNNNCEVGYCIGSKYWNKGIMTEALKTVIEFLFKKCDYHIIEAEHNRENIASGKVMEKSGMIKECVLKERNKLRDGKYYDVVLYSIINNH